MKANGTNPARTATYNGRPIRILATDTDPTATWWICYIDEPDTALFVKPSDIQHA